MVKNLDYFKWSISGILNSKELLTISLREDNLRIVCKHYTRFDNLKILLFNGCWSPNIGNAFVNIGIEHIIKNTIPECEIYYSADVSNSWFFSIADDKGEYTNNAFNISKYIDVDLVVWGGMMLTKECIDSAGDIFLSFSKRNIPIIFVGAGADKYDHEEQEYVSDFFKEIELIGIITRDDDTYNMYAKYAFLKDKISKGIDAAFFIAESNVPKLNIPKYDIECFDRISHPFIDHEDNSVIYTHHDCYGKLPEIYINKGNTLISELPYDYLALYKNVHCTYAERVHACIASLAFGNYAQLFSKTPRASLFNKIICGEWKNLLEKPLKVDQNKLIHEKKNMLYNFKSMYKLLAE